MLITHSCEMAAVDFQRRLVHNTLAGCDELVQRTVTKMLIIVPESCFCAPEITEPGKLEHTDRYIIRVAHRAGNKNRDYKSSLYKIIDQQVCCICAYFSVS